MSSTFVPIDVSLKRQQAQQILTNLLECVQECQKRYGGKTELATEFDACVAALCVHLEAVFLHGLRVKACEEATSTRHHFKALKEVTDLVANSLHLNSPHPFWPFIKEYLTKHERERYEVLKQIWTDIGRGRAWIRSALNEKALERNLHTVLSNPALLKTYYEDWALLRDEEKNSMLPNMAAGLGSILFAISINKPEFNSEVVPPIEKFKTFREPIIDAPLRVGSDAARKGKKKRKVAKQTISFDADSADETKAQIKGRQMDANGMKQSPNAHDATKMNGGTAVNGEEKFANSLDGPLTLLEHNEIGELIPIFVESEDNVQNASDSCAPIEISTDISAVMGAVEARNRDEVAKLRAHITLLGKDNEFLRAQIAQYVGAIQMLKKSDEPSGSGAETGSEHAGCNGAATPDYRCEAQVFEEKLVQVAEMHAELMDFNGHLQKSLMEKERLIESLRTELERVQGGPLVINELTSRECCVNVWIPSAFLTGTGSDTHHVYQIFLRAGPDEWNIYRRYAQFHALHTDLRKLDPVVLSFDFPPKKSIGNRDSAVVEVRRKKFQAYLRRVLMHWPELGQCKSRFLLEQHLTFFKLGQRYGTTQFVAKPDERPNDKKSAYTNPIPKRSLASDNHYTGL